MMRITGFYSIETGMYQINIGEYELALIIEAVRTSAGSEGRLPNVNDDLSMDLYKIATKIRDIVLHR
jgi:hypothetical protein